eukprot:TRINITY_DN20956_c0_g1_i4.p1 TRINITY_DN20956_c0_g1~~TRINITY_DN20956_c0_g1_i4.p1  ORF type:complete len:353 (+),score=109.83 TRINITY_DN20956_c0_g1_i4:60-1061(+)
MAEIGKGDPRWIVEERQDGANVNNWHWTERDILEWAKEQIKEILEGNVFEKSEKLEVSTKEVSNIEGDCLIMNRKKKVICSFDLKLEVSWEGKILDADTGDVITTVTGKMVIPDVDDTTLGEDMQVDVTCAESGDAADLVLEAVRKGGRKFVRKGLEEFAETLKDVHQVANKTQSVVTDAKSPTNTTSNAKKTQTQVGSTDTLNLRLDWRCPPAELWDCLTNPGKASAYTRSNVTLELRENGAFSYLGGSISGTFTSVDAPKGFSMKWRLDNWDPDWYSEVTISLDSHEAGATELLLSQTNIPHGEADRVKNGWASNFWEPMKVLFGFMYTHK